MNPINPQTPGPIVAVKHYLHVPAFPRVGYEQGACLASVGNITNREGDARLLAASFNAFDKAGRALGVDAAELAERIDLAALIKAAGWAATVLVDTAVVFDSLDLGRIATNLREESEKLRAVLKPVQNAAGRD